MARSIAIGMLAAGLVLGSSLGQASTLRIALNELDGDDVPDEVAIDEAVTLARRYATDDAARLVNGILGRIVREKV